MVNESTTKPSWQNGLRRWVTVRNLAGLGIVAELLGAIRTLAEPYRLYASSPPPAQADIDSLHLGALIFVCGTLLTVLPYLLGRYRLSLLAFALTIAGMVAFKQMYLPNL